MARVPRTFISRPLGHRVAVAARRAQPVLLVVVGAGGLDVAGQSGAEAREAGADRLQGDRLAVARSGTSGGYFRPSAAQCTTRASSAIRTAPSSKVSRPRSTDRTCPRRTTSSTVRSRSSSQVARVGALAIVGSTPRSMRSMTPRSSSRRNSSSSDADAAADSMTSAAMPRKIAGSGWTSARLSIHGSRGRTQQIASGSTPRPSSQTHASVAVLPDPTTTYCPGASSSRARSLTGTHPGALPDAERRRLLRGDARREVVRVDDAAAVRHPDGLAGDPRDDGAVAVLPAAVHRRGRCWGGARPGRSPAGARGPGRSRR